MPLSLAVLGASLGLAAAPARAAALMPAPAAVALAGQPVAVGASWTIAWKHYRDPQLERATGRFLARLAMRTGLAVTSDAGRPAQVIEIDCAGRDPQALALGADERYRLTVERDHILLQASTATGVLRGLATLIQLVEPAATGSGFQFAAARIDDQPRYPWRGLLIDTARHFVALDTLKRQIDAMELVKLNVLHLHLSDNEGFRVESKVFPRLQSASGAYSQAEIRELIAYAADRGVRVVPEFDAPGHVRSWFAGYPELRSNPAPAAGGPWFSNDTLDPSRDETYRFVGRLFGEMSRLFPDAYFHIGGDEVSGVDWNASARIQRFKAEKGLADNRALQVYFTERVRQILQANGKTMIGWDEVLQPNLDTAVVVEAWRSSKMSALAARAGHPTLSAGGYYLDRLLPAGAMYATDPADPAGYGVTPAQWAQIEKTPLAAALPRDAYEIDPALRLEPVEAARTLGGEAAMWTELATSEMIDGRVWPRAAAVAERLWSPAAVRDEADMYRRLAVLDRELEVFGLQHRLNRARMLSRLQSEPDAAAARFLDVVEPVKNLAHWKTLRGGFRAPVPQEFNELADAAAPESLTARLFEFQVRAFLAAPSADAAEALKRELAAWRDNHPAFTAAAQRSPALRPALPVSADLAAQAAAASEAVDAIVAGRALPSEWRARQTALLQRDEAWREASASQLAALISPQPPADLTIAITPGVRLLVDRATTGQEAAR